VRSARAEHERTRLELAQQLIELCSAVRRACVRARSAERMLALERDACAAARAAAELMHGLRSAGNVNAPALAQLELERARAERALAWAESLRVQERAALQALLGTGVPSEGWTLAPEVEPLARALPEPEQLRERALSASLTLEQERCEARAAAAALDLELAQARFGPGEFGLALQRRAEDGEWGFGPSLSLALPVSDTGGPARARAEARLAASLARGAALELELAASALQLGERARACAEQVRLVREHELVAAQSLVRARVRDYNAMQTGAFELLHARAQELETERALLGALAQARLARIDLDELLAGGAPPAHVSSARSEVRAASAGMRHTGGTR
jgi:outer membrane protein TolC